jgi:phage terminase Nu1 subunit (DNA packaging protein)
MSGQAPLDKTKWISIAELARLRGVSVQAISELVAKGKLDPSVQTVPGRKRPVIFRDLAIKILDGNPATKKMNALESTDPADILGTEPADENDDKIPAIVISNARAAHFKAKLARLEFLEKSGQLIDSEAVKKEAFRMGRTIRDRVEAIPDRIAAIVAAETNVKKVHKLLAAEFRGVLEDLAK